jgi:hypothetical protein
MTAVDNAVALMNDDVLLKKIKAVEVYVARQVVIEAGTTPSHAVRLKMAQTAIYNPDQHAPQLANIVACDPDICQAYTSGSTIPDSVLIQKMSDLWTPVATMLYPSS